VDTPEKPKRPWWKKKRWWPAFAIWLVMAYFASEGPMFYLLARGWFPKGLAQAVYFVPMSYIPLPESVERLLGYYLTWCRDRAWIDMGREVDPTN
jgi:hypothetical protein